jgi:pimeloyl-ACP methyl ester carboxylesterase
MRCFPPLRAAVCFLTAWIVLGAPASAAPLAALPVPAESFDVGSLHVDRYGDSGPTIVFVPGLGSGPWTWAEQIGRFSRTNRVYALTLDGFDGRPFTPQADSFATFTSDFWKLLDARHIVRPVVIGHSLGGTLAIALAEQHPERVAGVIALDGLPVFPTLAQQTDAQRAATADGIAADLARQTPSEFRSNEVSFMRSTGVLDATLVEPTAALEARSDPRAVAAWAKADFATDLRPDLAKATTPILELMPYAPGSPYTEQQTRMFYMLLVGGAPQIDVVPIENAKHFAMLDAPGAVDDAIAHFLAAHPPGAAAAK